MNQSFLRLALLALVMLAHFPRSLAFNRGRWKEFSRVDSLSAGRRGFGRVSSWQGGSVEGSVEGSIEEALPIDDALTLRGGFGHPILFPDGGKTLKSWSNLMFAILVEVRTCLAKRRAINREPARRSISSL